MQLLVQTPRSYIPERSYIIDFIFKIFLGLDYKFQACDRKDVSISSPDGKEIILPDVLFSTPEKNWLKSISMPRYPLKLWYIKNSFTKNPILHDNLPIIYGKDVQSPEFFNIKDKRINLGIDIFGSAFFMLSRYEEVVSSYRDEQDRFPARESLAFKENFILRPIVNEYIEIFWECLNLLWVGLNRKTHKFRILASHDVDNPFELLITPFPYLIVKNILPLTIKGRLIKAFSKLSDISKAKFGHVKDRHDTYEWLMDQADNIGTKCAFYLKSNQIKAKHDRPYKLNHPIIQDRINKIIKRGHEIGFHPGFHTYNNRSRWFAEFEYFKKMFPDINIKGGRQHFLKFKIPDTWRYWEEAGFEYDSTLGFADHSGFRCGICQEFQVYDIIQRKKLALKERPLIVMEKSLIQPKYMAMNATESRKLIDKLKGEVKFYNGDFVVLWHNSNLKHEQDIELYRHLIIKDILPFE